MCPLTPSKVFENAWEVKKSKCENYVKLLEVQCRMMHKVKKSDHWMLDRPLPTTSVIVIAPHRVWDNFQPSAGDVRSPSPRRLWRHCHHTPPPAARGNLQPSPRRRLQWRCRPTLPPAAWDDFWPSAFTYPAFGLTFGLCPHFSCLWPETCQTFKTGCLSSDFLWMLRIA